MTAIYQPSFIFMVTGGQFFRHLENYYFCLVLVTCFL